MLAGVIIIYYLLIFIIVEGPLNRSTHSSLQAILILLVFGVILDYLCVLRSECICEQFRQDPLRLTFDDVLLLQLIQRWVDRQILEVIYIG